MSRHLRARLLDSVFYAQSVMAVVCIHGESYKKIPTTQCVELQGFLQMKKKVKRAYLLRASATFTAQATVQPTIGLFPIPRKPIISTWAGTELEPAN